MARADVLSVVALSCSGGGSGSSENRDIVPGRSAGCLRGCRSSVTASASRLVYGSTLPLARPRALAYAGDIWSKSERPGSIVIEN